MKQRLDKHFLLNRAFVGTLLAIAVPIALQNMIRFRRGRYGQRDAGKLRRCGHCRGKPGRTAVFHLMSFGFGLSSGGSVLIAQYWGKGRHRAHPQVMRISMQLVFPGVAGHHRRLPAHARGASSHLYQR